MTFVISPMVALPRMDAAEAAATVIALKTALHLAMSAQVRSSAERAANARGKRREGDAPVVPVAVHASVPACMKRLDARCTALTQARHDAALRDEGRPNRVARRQLFARYKKAWTAVRSLVGVWRETGALASLPPAQLRGVDQVFPDKAGPQARNATALRTWGLGRETFERVKALGVDAAFASLGGSAALAHVTRLHDELGAALGVTSRALPAAAEGGAVATELSAVQSLMREYVIKVHAMVDPEAPGSQALAEALLLPFGALRKAGRPASTKSEEAPVDHPVDPPVTPVEPALRPTG